MRSLILSILLLLAITAITAADSFFMFRGIEQMEALYTVFSEEEIISEDTAEQASAIFERYHTLFAISISRDAVDSMEHALLLLSAASKTKSAADASAARVSYRYALNELREMGIPSFETVF